ASNFKPLYEALLIYKDKTIKAYEILADGNSPDNIPAINNKDGGLIRVFLDGFTIDYGKSMYQNLPDRKYKTIYEFLTAFYKGVQVHYHNYVETKNMNHFFAPIVGETPAKSISRPSTYN